MATEERRRRRRGADLDSDDLLLVTATSKATLRQALDRMDRVLARAEQVLADEQEDRAGGG